jgi:hypothetical protein
MSCANRYADQNQKRVPCNCYRCYIHVYKVDIERAVYDGIFPMIMAVIATWLLNKLNKK